MSGVYIIRCTATGELYVGATKTNFRQRVANHKSALHRGDHHVPLLQTRWNEHGEEAFEFAMLREFPPEDVHRRERQAIACLRPAFNLSNPPVGCPKGARHEDALRVDIDGRLWTIEQVAAHAGVTSAAVRARLKRGLSGNQLLARSHGAKRKSYTRR